MPRVELLVGMIGSGKTTYARQRAKEGAMIVSHDELTEMLHGEYTYLPDFRETYKAMMRSLAFYSLEAGRDVIIDRTHLTRESRVHWTGYVHQINRTVRPFQGVGKVEVVAVVFPVGTPELHARRRFDHDARGRPYQDWLKVAQGHFEQAKAEPLDMLLERFHDTVNIAQRLGVAPAVSSLSP